MCEKLWTLPGAASGLRLGDLLRLSWSHVQDDAIVITTGKSNHKRMAIIPLYDGLREVLARIPKRATTVLTNSLGRPWTAGGFAASFHRAKIAAGIGDLHFHDLRGTAATKFYIAGLPERVIAENPRLAGGKRRQDHPPLCRSYRCNEGDHPATESTLPIARKENKACKTRCKTVAENSS